MPYDIVCPNCKRSYYETLDHGKRIKTGKKSWIENPMWQKYDPDKPFDPRMAILKDPWKTWGWNDAARYGETGPLECPGCDFILAHRGQTPLLEPKNKELLKDYGPRRVYSDPRGRFSADT